MNNILKPVETKIIGGKTFNVFRSSNNMYIQKVGTNELYSEATDLAYLNNQFIETNIPLPTESEEILDENSSR